MSLSKYIHISNEGIWNTITGNYSNLYKVLSCKGLKYKNSYGKTDYDNAGNVITQLLKLDPEIIDSLPKSIVTLPDNDWVEITNHYIVNSLNKCYDKGYKGTKFVEKFIEEYCWKDNGQYRKLGLFKKDNPSYYNKLINILKDLFDEKNIQFIKKG